MRNECGGKPSLVKMKVFIRPGGAPRTSARTAKRIARIGGLCYRFAGVFARSDTRSTLPEQRARCGAKTRSFSSLARSDRLCGFLAVGGRGERLERQGGATPAPRQGPFRVYVGTYTGGSGRDDKSQGIYLLDLDLRSGKLGAPRLACEGDRSVVPGHSSEPQVSLRRERAWRKRRASRRGSRRVFDRSASGNPDTDQPAIVARQRALPPRRGPGGKKRAGGELRQRERGLPADRRGRTAFSELVIHPAQGHGQRSWPAGGAARALDQSRRWRAALPSRPTSGSTRSSSTASTTEKGTLAANEPPFAEVAPRSGPRHFAFDPGGRFGYVINEMANTVTAFAYDAGERAR